MPAGTMRRINGQLEQVGEVFDESQGFLPKLTNYLRFSRVYRTMFLTILLSYYEIQQLAKPNELNNGK